PFNRYSTYLKLCRPQPEQETPKIVVESAKFMTRRAAPKGPEASDNHTPLETDFRYKIFYSAKEIEETGLRLKLATTRRARALTCQKIHPNRYRYLQDIYPVRSVKRLREWAIDHGEDPDRFMTITEKDRNLSRIYRDRIMSDAEIIDFARDQNLNPEELMDMSRRERLISEEIYLREWKDEGTPRSHVYNDEEWIKNIAILQESGYL
ncbi:8100_t:CDS:2, partial [Paraglomus brasilianum]